MDALQGNRRVQEERGDGMSSILIKRMEMPKRCLECPCIGEMFGTLVCLVTSNGMDYKDAMGEGRPDFCPLIELPPHGRLIDISTVEEIRFHDADGYHVINGEQLCELEIDAKTVIEAEGSE